MKTPSNYLLILRALPADVPAVIRLRRLLKSLLRRYQFRCLRAVEVAADQGADQATDAPAG